MYKWTVGALLVLHEGMEGRMITILEKANLAAIHVGWVTLMAKDIELAMQLSDTTANYKTMSSVTEKVSPEEENKKEESCKNKLEHLKNRKKNTEKSNKPGVSGIAADEGILDDDSDSVTVVVRSGKKKKTGQF